MKRRSLLFLIVFALSISVMPAVRAQGEVFRVAAVAPSATNDLAFSQSMFDALTLLDEELGDGFEFTFQEGTFIVDDAAVALRDWASSGEYDLIIAHGSQYGAILEELAPDFPDISFAWGTDVNTFGLDNVYAYTAAADQGGYINGAIAATLTRSGVIGVVGPIEVGDAKLYVDGFKAGAAATNPDVQVLVTYIQSFSDVPLATEAAEAHVSNGADILTGTAQMVVGPIAVAKENGLRWFGTQSSQAALAEEAGVAFQVYRWDVILRDMIAKRADGVLGGESYVIDLENGGLMMELSPALDPDRAAALQDLIDALSEGIISGEIVTLPSAASTPEAPEPASTPEAGR